VVRSRKRKATQPDAGRRDNSRVSERHEDDGSGLQVRQDRDSRVHLRFNKGKVDADHSHVHGGSRTQQNGDVKLGSTYNTDIAEASSKQERHHSSSGNVSYYFTNIPECLPIFLLRQQFEVCIVLTDVFVARQRNARGQVYGFVRFSHVKNADKLSKALNNVLFGHIRVWAREARFDRFADNDKKPLVVSKQTRHKE